VYFAYVAYSSHFSQAHSQSTGLSFLEEYVLYPHVTQNLSFLQCSHSGFVPMIASIGSLHSAQLSFIFVIVVSFCLRVVVLSLLLFCMLLVVLRR